MTPGDYTPPLWPFGATLPDTEEIWRDAIVEFLPKPNQKVRIMVSTPSGYPNPFHELWKKNDEAYLCYRNLPDPPGAISWFDFEPSALLAIWK